MISKLLFKKFLLIIIFLISNLSLSKAEIINKFKIDGNERIPDETIIMFSGINIGEDVTTTRLNEILKRIYDSNFFKDVNVSLNQNTLSINVKENPLIENIEINGPKAKKIIKALKNNLKLKERSSYNEILILEDKKKMLMI